MFRMTRLVMIAALAMSSVWAVACGGGAPGEASLRDSFLDHLASNASVKGATKSPGELKFEGPGPEGEASVSWVVTIDSASIEANSDAKQPYKGLVKSTWKANGRAITPRGTESGLPPALMSTGLAQECWAFWDAGSSKWSWE